MIYLPMRLNIIGKGVGIMESIQQLIKKFYSTKDKQVYSEIIERIKIEELLWVSYMPYTNNYCLNFENGKPSPYIFTYNSGRTGVKPRFLEEIF